MSFGHALYVFRRLCQEVLFQPERDPDARLDVLGMLEAEGGHWDGVWVLGLTDQVFPAVPKPNPFIPFSALARHQTPRSTPDREFERSEEHTAEVQTRGQLVCRLLLETKHTASKVA